MIAKILTAIGLVLAIEGLVLALAPKRIEDVLDLIRSMSVEQRRLMGLLSVALGVAIVWIVKSWVV